MPLDDERRDQADSLGASAQQLLKDAVQRIERLYEDKVAVDGDLREVYQECRGNGFDVKILRKVIAIRRADAAKRSEEEALVQLYLDAIGDL